MSTNKNILAEGIEITGTIKFRNDMIIDGKVEGEIQSDEGSLTIGENARIKGDIHTGEIKMYGRVKGAIHAGQCELKANSQLDGDITTGILKMDEGAAFSGKMQTGK